MHTKYNEIFDNLVKSYYSGDFEKTLNHIMDGHDKSPQETFSIICSLCGVSIPFDNNYIYNLKKAITQYSINQRIVEKLEDCSINCKPDSNNKFKCEATCPFDAISYDITRKSTLIDTNLCTDCGLCVDVCSSGRIVDKVQFLPVKELIDNNETVVAIVAPSIIGQFGENVSIDKLREAFMKLGFSDMIEVAFAADMLTIKEAVEFNKHVNSPSDIMITSCCCPMWVGMLKKVYKTLVKDLSPSVSPMIAAGRVIKKLNPDAKVVFIGPCIAKKAEARDTDIKGAVDFVMTYQEVDEIFKALSIDLSQLSGIPSVEYASRGGRLYARTGGVSIAISEAIQELYPEKYKLLKPIHAEGIKACKEVLDKALNGTLDANFIEGMGCVGGCVGGPKVLIPADIGTKLANDFAYDSPIKVATHNPTLDNVLLKLNIETLKDFENAEKIDILERKF